VIVNFENDCNIVFIENVRGASEDMMCNDEENRLFSCDVNDTVLDLIIICSVIGTSRDHKLSK